MRERRCALTRYKVGMLPRLELLILLAAASCAAAHPTTTATAAPARGDVVRVGTSLDYRPFSYRGSDGEPQGTDVELVKRWAAARHRSVRFVTFRWSELAARFAAGEFDVVAGGVTVRGDRLALGPMTVATARTRALVLVPRAPGAAAGAPAIPRRVAVNRGGHLEALARRLLPDSELAVVDDNRRLVETVRAGAAAGLVTDSAEAEALGLVGPAASSAWDVAAVLAYDEKAWWVAPGRADLLAELDGWLRAQKAPATPSALLLELVNRRLLLMPEVARAKRAAGLPVEDRTREAAVIERARQAAAAAGLDRDSWALFVRAEMEAAKAVQAAGTTPDDGGGAPFSLQQQLRPAIDRLDRAIVAEAARIAPICDGDEVIARALREDAAGATLPAPSLQRLAEAVRQVQPVPPRACR